MSLKYTYWKKRIKNYLENSRIVRIIKKQFSQTQRERLKIYMKEKRQGSDMFYQSQNVQHI